MWTKEQHNEYHKIWGKNNRNKTAFYLLRWRNKRKIWLNEIKKKMKCGIGLGSFYQPTASEREVVPQWDFLNIR